MDGGGENEAGCRLLVVRGGRRSRRQVIGTY